jgi:hypothetical protein
MIFVFTVVLCITALYVNLSQVWQKKFADLRTKYYFVICGFETCGFSFFVDLKLPPVLYFSLQIKT